MSTEHMGFGPTKSADRFGDEERRTRLFAVLGVLVAGAIVAAILYATRPAAPPEQWFFPDNGARWSATR